MNNMGCVIIAYDGTEIIDATPEALERIDSMKYADERRVREARRNKLRKKRSLIHRILTSIF